MTNLLPPEALRRDIIEGCARGETVVVSRETFWHVAWKDGAPVMSALGDFIAELRNAHGIRHGASFGGYEFFKIKKA